MLNTVLEKNHEEMFEYHFKHELMNSNLAQKKHSVMSPLGMRHMLKLIMGCEDPNYRIQLADSPNMAGGGLFGSERSPKV